MEASSEDGLEAASNAAQASNTSHGSNANQASNAPLVDPRPPKLISKVETEVTRWMNEVYLLYYIAILFLPYISPSKYKIAWI